jgi:hypothetical protein
MAVGTTEIRGEPVLRNGRSYVPVARRTEARLSFRGITLFARYDRPARIEVGDAPPVRIVDWELVLRAASAVVAAAVLTMGRKG